MLYHKESTSKKKNYYNCAVFPVLFVIPGMNFVLMPSCSLFQFTHDKYCTQQKGHRAQSFGISQALRAGQLEDVGISAVAF